MEEQISETRILAVVNYAAVDSQSSIESDPEGRIDEEDNSETIRLALRLASNELEDKLVKLVQEEIPPTKDFKNILRFHDRVINFSDNIRRFGDFITEVKLKLKRSRGKDCSEVILFALFWKTLSCWDAGAADRKHHRRVAAVVHQLDQAMVHVKESIDFMLRRLKKYKSDLSTFDKIIRQQTGSKSKDRVPPISAFINYTRKDSSSRTCSKYRKQLQMHFVQQHLEIVVHSENPLKRSITPFRGLGISTQTDILCIPLQHLRRLILSAIISLNGARNILQDTGANEVHTLQRSVFPMINIFKFIHNLTNHGNVIAAHVDTLYVGISDASHRLQQLHEQVMTLSNLTQTSWKLLIGKGIVDEKLSEKDKRYMSLLSESASTLPTVYDIGDVGLIDEFEKALAFSHKIRGQRKCSESQQCPNGIQASFSKYLQPSLYIKKEEETTSQSVIKEDRITIDDRPEFNT